MKTEEVCEEYDGVKSGKGLKNELSLAKLIILHIYLLRVAVNPFFKDIKCYPRVLRDNVSSKGQGSNKNCFLTFEEHICTSEVSSIEVLATYSAVGKSYVISLRERGTLFKRKSQITVVKLKVPFRQTLRFLGSPGTLLS